MSNKTHPEGHSTREEWREDDDDRRGGQERRQSIIDMPLQETTSSKRRASMSFVVALSIVFGVILAGGTILGVMGKAFYVSREEYTDKNLRDAEQQVMFKQGLEQITRTLSRQEAAFDRFSTDFQNFKLDMAKR